ncbi:GNAT family N-acetyltransferase [Skermania sp. ID1734]|nr:GNAT family N-acetyltransferase [Skermania sp. ID1734]
MQWMWPDDSARAAGLPKLFAALIRFHYLSRGGVELAGAADGTVGGAALWAPPGQWQQSRFSEFLMLPSLIRAFGKRLEVGGNVAETMKRNHPEEPHWYLAVIGTDPDVRGTGLGYALMRSRLDRVDAEHAPAYLESSKPDNVPYYERFGFEVTHELPLPNGGPPVWAMWRRPA